MLTYMVYGGDPCGMARQLMNAVGARTLIPAGSSIAIKPNLVVSRPATDGATTHPQAVAGVLEYLRDNGFTDISIMESSWVGDNTSRAFSVCGYHDLAKRYGARLVDLKGDASTPVETPLGTVRICDRVRNAGFVVNMPVLKGHCQVRMTCAVKNLKGCIPDAEKRRFHRDGLGTCIAALSLALRPGLTVVDGMCGDLEFEEGGNPVYAGRMFAGSDPLRVDALGCRLMGIDARDIEYLALAADQSHSHDVLSARDPVELNHPEASLSSTAPSGKARRLMRGVDVDKACSPCQANLVHALRRLEEKGVHAGKDMLRLGQGWRGRKGTGIGIGRCAAGMSGMRIPGCPPSADAIVDALMRGR